MLNVLFWSWDSVIGIATDYGLDDLRGWSSSPCRFKNFLHSIQTSSGVHPVSYPMGTEGKEAGA
jgi:hypothetical protein